MGFYDSMIKGLAGFFCALYRIPCAIRVNMYPDFSGRASFCTSDRGDNSFLLLRGQKFICSHKRCFRILP